VTTNRKLLDRRRRVSPSWMISYHEDPIAIERGEGRHVWDVEGNRYLDFFGGILTTMVGYGIPEITEAIQRQAAKVVHTSTLYLNEPAIDLAEKVAEVSGIPDARVFFTTSGTEATDAALLLATSYRRSNQVLAMRNSYHGRSFTAVAVTSHRSWSPTSYTGINVNSQPVPRPGSRRLRRSVAGGPAAGDRHDDVGRRRLPAGRADPGCRRLLAAARRPVRGDGEDPRRLRDPLHLR
jgi:4-aminobutyrate aminotransferase